MEDKFQSSLFVVGAPRGGTSLLRNLIRACDNVYLPPDETQFLPAFLEKADKGASREQLIAFLESTPFGNHMRERGIWPSGVELEQIMADPTPRIAMPRLMGKLALAEGAAAGQVWGDKTPKYVFFLDTLTKAFPESKVLFVVRDPRDTVLSMREAWGRSLVRGAVVWRDSARVAREWLSDNDESRCRKVHYETLVSDPVPVMQEVAEWLGVGFDVDALNHYTGEERWGAARGPGVQNSSVARYRGTLSERNIETIEAITGLEMEWFGYARDSSVRLREPSKNYLRLLRLLDGFHSLRRYGSDRGFIDGVLYRFRQFTVARRHD